MSRVLLAMSGGVDSSACAVLLQEAGEDVVGVFMRNGVVGDGVAREKSCCSASDARDAAAVADRLGIPFYSVDYAEEFGKLMDYFADEYRLGRTPNPCVLCNQHLKFGHLFSLADAVGADTVATGHYAKVENGRMLRSVDQDKDQTYYLFGVDREALTRVRFPLGDLTKAEVRGKAEAAGLRTANKAESMDICFVTSGDYREVVQARGGAGRPGVFHDGSGTVVGEHRGIDGYTVGQRRGLPAMGVPYYVRAIDPETGAIQICAREGLLAGRAAVRGVNWLVDPPDGPMRADVKIRARSAAAPAQIVPGDEPGVVEVRFAAEVAAITPGQAAVFYADDLVLGGGWID
jgi:tRNA-uridine 2-sulfurtransferase